MPKITRCLSTEELDALEAEMLDYSNIAIIAGSYREADIWKYALRLIARHRTNSYYARLTAATAAARGISPS